MLNKLKDKAVTVQFVDMSEADIVYLADIKAELEEKKK